MVFTADASSSPAWSEWMCAEPPLAPIESATPEAWAARLATPWRPWIGKLEAWGPAAAAANGGMATGAASAMGATKTPRAPDSAVAPQREAPRADTGKSGLFSFLVIMLHSPQPDQRAESAASFLKKI
jgi:hypothetical protein